MKSDIWTQELTMRLRQLVFEFGMSYADAARNMGLTKNQCIGRAHRLGWSQPKNTPKVASYPGGVSFEFPRVGHCVYPHGDPGEDGFGFCGERALEGGPYCAKHHRACYRPAGQIDAVKAINHAAGKLALIPAFR